MGKYSHIKFEEFLRVSGFKRVLGRVEEFPGGKATVNAGTPMTYEINNGVMAVYDESGAPWIRYYTPQIDRQALLSSYPVRRGAYVPFSNDGGHFVQNVLPTL